ncbi:hypothetical protein [Paenibacillus sp. LK1]|uniref:hypothetical protein n=1 Tax=Paenibacillus sp. LK1 TaxID=2053014 RepID=UPI000C18965D|nr:hypothetical protein [Paenibacillus sp. LK1]PIH59085.1 hypothetical protein CS562_14175 [Paenibacillus sp. LK1]
MINWDNVIYSSVGSGRHEMIFDNNKFIIFNRETGTSLASDFIDLGELKHVLEKYTELMEHNDELLKQITM